MHLGALLSFTIVCLALWVLFHTLEEISVADVLKSFRDLTLSAILLAFLITALSYFVITGYDVLALHHIGRPLPYWRSGLAAFLASAFGNNIGFALVTGGSIRYRLYSQAGLTALEVAGVSTMCSLTSGMGMAFVLALSMAFASGDVTEAAIRLPVGLRRVIGAIMLIAMASYLVAAAIRPLSIRTRNWSLQLPSAGTALMQGTLATLEMLLVGSLIYVLLPDYPGQSFITFLGVFVLALMAGSMSNVPGGIGVFETVLLLGLPEVPPAALIGSVLLFRCIYFLVPLSLAALLFASYEAILQRTRFLQLHGITTDWLAEIGPQVMAVIVLSGGIILLLSGTIPADPTHHELLRTSLPLWVVELSHLLASAAGVGIILLARGITRRLRAAYVLTALLLGAGVVASYLKGLDFDEAVALGVILAILLPARREFYRGTSLYRQGFAAEWVSVLAALLAVTVWLGLFNYKQFGYEPGLWWTFSYEGDYARFLRSTFAVFAITGAAMVITLLQRDPELKFPDQTELERIRRIARNNPDTRANLALLGDKRLFVSDASDAFIMYQVQGRSWIALGDPIGPKNQRRKLLWAFRDLCDRHGGWPVFYLVDGEGLSLYVDLGLSLLKLGDEARVPLSEFSVLSVASAEVRNVHRQVRNQHVHFEMVASAQVPALIAELQEVSDGWLAHTRSQERGFSRGFFEARYVSRFPCAVVRQGNRIVAFAILWASRNKDELALDLMRYHPDAPQGIMDYLLVELMLGGKQRGYRWFNLGIAPLTSLDSHPLAPVWHRIGKLIYRQSEHFGNIESLRRYEENFKPAWRPKYLASPGGLNLPRILYDVGRLISRGPELRA